MASLEKIGRNYIEQLHTTLETMRRRGLELYDRGEDLAVGLGNGLASVGGYVDDALKMAKEDSTFKKQVVADICDQKPLDTEEKKKQNSVQELYFGMGILMMALGAGQLTGLLLASMFSSIFSPLVVFALILLLPVYAYLKLKKNFEGYDEVERRDWLYAFVFGINVLVGDMFGYRLLATVPTVFFVSPFVFALATDVELCPKSLYRHRIRLLAVASVASFVCMHVLSIVTGIHGAVSSLSILLNCLVTVLHFQLVHGNMDRSIDNKQKFPVSESQALYVLAVVFMQLPLSLLATRRV